MRHSYAKGCRCEDCKQDRRERQALYRDRKRAQGFVFVNGRFREPREPRPLQPCGTIAAYKRHREHGEEACQPCKTAWASYTASYARQRDPGDERRVLRPPVVSSERWVHLAACKGKEPTMFASTLSRKRTKTDLRRVEAAKAICASCPALSQCREWALQDPDPVPCHVAGGMAPWERMTCKVSHPGRKLEPAREGETLIA